MSEPRGSGWSRSALHHRDVDRPMHCRTNHSVILLFACLPWSLHVANDVQQNTICCLWCNFSFELECAHAHGARRTLACERDGAIFGRRECLVFLYVSQINNNINNEPGERERIDEEEEEEKKDQIAMNQPIFSPALILVLRSAWLCVRARAVRNWLHLVSIDAHPQLSIALAPEISARFPFLVSTKMAHPNNNSNNSSTENHPNHISVFDFSFFFFSLSLIICFGARMRGRTIECALFTWQNTCNTHAENLRYHHIAISSRTTDTHVERGGRAEKTWRMLCSVRTHSLTHSHRHVARRVGTSNGRHSIEGIGSARAAHERTHTHTRATELTQTIRTKCGSPVGFMYTRSRNVYMCFSARKTEILMFYF